MASQRVVKRGARRMPRRPGGDIRVGPLLPIPALLAEHGVDPAQVLARVGLEESLFRDPDKRIALRTVGRLLETCVQTTGCRHFGLLVGERFEFESLGALGQLMRNCSTVRDALRMGTLHLDLHDRGAVGLMFDLDGSRAAFGYSLFVGDTPAADQILDAAVAIELHVLRELCGRSWKPLWVQLSHSRPEKSAPFRKSFGARLVFDARVSAIVFESRWLARRVAGADPAARARLLDAIESDDASRRASFAEQVRRAIHAMMLAAHATSPKLAAMFGLHERALRRRLAAEGVTVRQLVGEVRRELAHHLLHNTEIAVTEVAAILGYSDGTSFARAFRAWSGVSPRAWRMQG